MKKLSHIAFLLVLAVSVTGCQDKDDRNYRYMPNMYVSVPYDTYGQYEVFPDNQEAMEPAPGSVSRGWLPYGYENSNEGYASAKANLQNPLPYTEDNVNKGDELYTIYCAICHGDKGDGQGHLVTTEKILGIPSYDDPGRAITPGSIYHVMYYGLNTMGSYASQTSEKERWQIAHYVMSLKRALEGQPERPFVGQENDSIVAPVEGEMATDEEVGDTESTMEAPETEEN